MSVTPAYRARVLEQLAGTPAVRVRSLFGEVGLYAEDLLFGMIVDDALYFKVDDTTRADYEAAGGVPFVAPWNPGKPTAYYAVPAAVLADAARVRAWADGARAVAARAPKKRAARRAP